MQHLTIELLLMMLLAFLIGCIIGCLLRKMFGTSDSTAHATAAAAGTAAVAGTAAHGTAAPRKTEAEAVAKVAPARPATPVPAPASEAPTPAPVAAAAMPAASTGKPARPKGMAGARGGKADNLQVISGVGPKLEKTLHSLGFFHYDQIANWTGDEVEWVDEHLRFKGRIEREEWIPQCKLLAEGDMDKFNRLYGTGGLRNSQGQRKSGSRTRRAKAKK